MAKPPRLPHVKHVLRRGKYYSYFNSGRKNAGGQPIYMRLPEFGTVGFYDSLAAYDGARNRKPATNYTVEHMAKDYRESREFAKLAKGSQKAYRSILGSICDAVGVVPVNDLERHLVVAVLDVEAFPAGKQNLFVAVLGALYRWGRRRGKTVLHPTKDIPKAETGERMPWPDDILEAALNADNARVRLATALLFYTGQRIGDVCAMKWAAIKDQRVTVIQEKTGKELRIPLHSALQAELDRHGKRGISLLVSEVGRPIKPQTVRDDLKAFCAGMGRTDLLPHGLRKNAVIALLKAGCSVAETSAITGQTYQLVEYYARQIEQGEMADSAILKFESGNNYRKVLTGKPE